MKAHPNNIIVFISEEERRKLFEKPIQTVDGRTLWLVTELKADINMEKSYEQTVNVGRVRAVGAHVQGIHPDDTVLIDYIVDVSDEHVIQADALGKLVSVPAVTTFHNKTLLIDANRKTKHPTLVYNEGEPDVISPVIAVVRDGKVYANHPYVLMKHEKYDDTFKARDEYMIHTQEWHRGEAVERTVVAAAPQSACQAGERVMVEEEGLFTREINGDSYDIAFEQDILLGVKFESNEADTVLDS